jgi:hypothetical protein
MRRLTFPALAVALAATTLLPQPWRLLAWAVLTAGFVAAVVLLVRGVRRDPGFVALSGYEWHRQTPDHVRDPGTTEGTVLPEKRLPRGR